MDDRRDVVLPILADTYGRADAERRFGRWRIFFMACAELSVYGGGSESGVSQFPFQALYDRSTPSAANLRDFGNEMRHKTSRAKPAQGGNE